MINKNNKKKQKFNIIKGVRITHKNNISPKVYEKCNGGVSPECMKIHGVSPLK